jgi:hypothetical protein
MIEEIEKQIQALSLIDWEILSNNSPPSSALNEFQNLKIVNVFSEMDQGSPQNEINSPSKRKVISE